MLKRSKTDDEIDLEEAGDDRRGGILVVNDDRNANELVARLLESAGFTAERQYGLDDVPRAIERGGHEAVVIDSLSCGITTAFRVLDEIRKAGPEVRGVAVVILAATNTNQLFAYQSGVDGYVVRPVHSDELLDVVRLVIERSSDERVAYRRAQLMGGATSA